MEEGRRTGEVKFVRIADAAALYRFVKRIPSSQRSALALEDLFRRTEFSALFAEHAQEAAETWSRNRRWAGIVPGDVRSLECALALAQAIHRRQHVGLDYRTFSRRAVGDSKALERLEAAVARVLRGVGADIPEGASPREALGALGLEKVSPPLLLSGPVAFGGTQLDTAFLGLPADAIDTVSFSRTPEYVLVVENYTSFVRHVTEADPDRRGLVIYGGGYPSAGVQKALGLIARRFPNEVPFYHWSDIDPDGIWIFLTVERAFGRRLTPHLMTLELAERHGNVPAKVASRVAKTDESSLFELIAYLSEPGAKHLEQEELDPIIPCLLGNMQRVT
nr:Wadjet anti-phage system protein JetD domain-containing protein [Mesorhizobium silamurunense]